MLSAKANHGLLHSATMKNVTITMDEEVARWANVQAAKMDTSLSRMLGETLREKMKADQGYEQAMSRFFSRPLCPLRDVDQAYPKRESIYDRFMYSEVLNPFLAI